METIVQFQLTGRGGTPSKLDGTSDTWPHDLGSQIISGFADAGVTDWLVGPPRAGRILVMAMTSRHCMTTVIVTDAVMGVDKRCCGSRHLQANGMASIPMRGSRIATAARTHAYDPYTERGHLRMPPIRPASSTRTLAEVRHP